MPDIIIDYAISAAILAIIAWACVYITRPFFQTKWPRVISQIAVALLLFVTFILARALSEEGVNVTAENAIVLQSFVLANLAMKAIAIYLIGCYAKSVGKSPYWTFVGVLNFLIVLPLLIFGLWKTPKPNSLSHEDMKAGLRRILDDPATLPEKREWATDRLKALEAKKI